MGEDRNPASFWNCGGRLGARAGQDSAYWRPVSVAQSRPLAARLPGVSQQRPPPPEHSEPGSLGDVFVPLATAGGNAVPPPGFGGGATAGALRLRPASPACSPAPSPAGERRRRGVGGRCGGRCAVHWVRPPPAAASLLDTRSRPPAHHPSTCLSHSSPRPLPPALRTGSSVIQVTSAEMPSPTTKLK